VPPVFRSVRREGQGVILEWRGQGVLQSSGVIPGAWGDVPNATSPHPISIDSSNRFYRLITQ